MCRRHSYLVGGGRGDRGAVEVATAIAVAAVGVAYHPRPPSGAEEAATEVVDAVLPLLRRGVGGDEEPRRQQLRQQP